MIQIDNLIFAQGSVVSTGDVTVTNISDLSTTQQILQNAVNQGSFETLLVNNVQSVIVTGKFV